MRYYVLKYRYLHPTPKGNLGDNVQSLSAIHMLKKIGIGSGDIDYLNRDELALKKEGLEKGIFLAQGWFGCMQGQQTFPIDDDNILPLYFGFHVNEGSWHLLENNGAFIQSMKKYEPIGCRDIGTRDFLHSLNVNAYFSRCLTMTFDKREKPVAGGKLFLIDHPDDLEPYIPKKLLKTASRLSQFEYSPSGYSPSGEWPMSEDDVRILDRFASQRLEILKKEASLVVTSRIHVAMPCAAMGIPVIYCYHNPFDARASVIKEILPIYEPAAYENIDWEPNIPDMEEIKRKIQLMLTYRIQVEENKLGLSMKRLSSEDFSKAEDMVKRACALENREILYKASLFSRKDVLETALGSQKESVLEKKVPLVLFGAGSAGKHLCAILKYFDISPDCFCDNQVKNDKELIACNLPVICFETLKKKFAKSLILITTKDYVEPIRNQLLENGFSEKQVIDGRPFLNKYIDFAVPK